MLFDFSLQILVQVHQVPGLGHQMRSPLINGFRGKTQSPDLDLRLRRINELTAGWVVVGSEKRVIKTSVEKFDRVTFLDRFPTGEVDPPRKKFPPFAPQTHFNKQRATGQAGIVKWHFMP